MADSYRVGRARPPHEHRFKKGRSGNPKGRPKGSKNVNALIRRMLDVTKVSPVDGKRISLRELILLAQMNKAARGSLPHAMWLLSQDQDQGGAQEELILIELDLGSPGLPPGAPQRQLE